MQDIQGHISDFASDVEGSRFIQSKFEEPGGEPKAWVFSEIAPNAVPLTRDVYGNYVIQKLFDQGTMEHKKAMFSRMKGKISELSTQMYACRVIQKVSTRLGAFWAHRRLANST